MTGLDLYTQEHLNRWITGLPPDERAHTRRLIGELLRLDPGLLEGHSWPELRKMAETAEAEAEAAAAEAAGGAE